MKKSLLLFLVMAASWAASMWAITDGVTYEAVNGIRIQNLWIQDRAHTGEQWSSKPYCNTSARTAVMTDGYIYISRTNANTVIQGTDTLSQSVVYKLNAATGEMVKGLPLTLDGAIYGNSVLNANTVGVDNFGHLYISPYTSELATEQPVYLLDGETGELTLVARLEKGDALARCDYIDVMDMIHFKLQLEMGTKGVESLLPLRCDLSGKFGFIGNRLRFSYHNVYGLPTFLPDSIRDNHDRHLMDQLRPDSLSEEERIIYHHYDSLETERELRRLADTTHVEVKKKHNFVKDVLWDMIGDNLVNRVKGSFGGKDKGTFRINPILNPLYFGYSGRKGFVYKFDVRAGYNFTPNRDISMRFKSGYSFKQRQFYFRLPMEFNYNKRRHAFFRVEVGNGNRISNSSILDAIYQEYESQHIPIDSTYISNLGLEDFRDTYVKMENNYDISDYWSILGGFVYHRRSAVNKAGFHELQRSHKYHTSAPALQLQFRPRGWDGPYFTLNWERSFKGLFNSDYEYEKYEFDASLIRQFHRLRSLSLRFGAGAYTLKNSKSYFLDYSNFRDENIRGGWKDDWSGNFQVLRSRYFNSSNYYIRGNATFESPLMILSRLPLVGKYLEMERIYSSALFTQNLKPYVEVGYGFTNRIFSLGVFVGTRNGKFDGIGCEFGIELFDKW